ncbi:MAG: YfiR family protein [Bacteroidales bacterium]|nr:YfiR family protein [Bacteroidales bacterium]
MKKIVFILFLMLMPLCAQAQNVQKAKAMLTFNFIRYIGWAEEVRQGDFVIGVLKEHELVSWLTKLSTGKKFGYQDIVIKEFKSIDDVEDCQVIFVGSGGNFNKNSEKLMSVVGKNTLIITEVDGATSKGSMINFVVRDDILKFELHSKNASISGVQFSAKLGTMTGAINL